MEKEDVVLIVAFIVGFILFIWYLFGKSPTLEQVIIGMLFINIGWTYSISTKLHRHLGQHEGYNKAKTEPGA